MKKLSILVALILCVTVGGVYATWMYPGNDITQVIQPVSNVMAEADFTGSFGTYHTDSNSLRLVIDQESPTSFKTVLKYEGELEVRFTPHENISDAQMAAAMGAVVSVTGSDLQSAEYNGKAIWNLSDTTIELNEDRWTPSGDTTYYTCTISCSELNNIITLANDFELPTIDDYNSFQQVQKLAVFRIKLTAKPLS